MHRDGEQVAPNCRKDDQRHGAAAVDDDEVLRGDREDVAE